MSAETSVTRAREQHGVKLMLKSLFASKRDSSGETRKLKWGNSHLTVVCELSN